MTEQEPTGERELDQVDEVGSWDVAQGDSPPYSETFVGIIEIGHDYYKRGGIARRLNFLYHIREKFLRKQNPHILAGVKRMGKDIIAMDGPLTRKILIGVGLAAAVAAGTYGMYKVIHRHRH